MPLFSRKSFFVYIFLTGFFLLGSQPLVFSQANTNTLMKDQLQRVEDKLVNLEKGQKEIKDKQDQIIATLEQLKVWVRRN